MLDGLLPWSVVSAFLAASLVLAAMPGPGVIYIVTRSLTQGRVFGLASVAGVALGNFCNAIGAALGLGVLLSFSSTAFLMVKYAGALYLIYLGIKALSTPIHTQQSGFHACRMRTVFRDGFFVALFNPKTTLFFAAFIPQFITPGIAPTIQGMFLGTLFVLIAAATDTAYALLAGASASLLRRGNPFLKFGRFVASEVYVGLGVFAAVSDSRTIK